MQSSASAIRRANNNIGINGGTHSPPIKKHSNDSQRHYRHYRSNNNNLAENSDQGSIGTLSSNTNSARQYGSASENLEKV